MQRNDYFSYNGEGDDKAFTNALNIIAQAPKIEYEREQIEREKQKELNKIYAVEVPDFSFAWQKEQQADMDTIADLGTKLTAMGYDPDSPSAMSDPKASEMYKEFQKKKVMLTQKSQASKYMQQTWDSLVKEVRNNPDKYADDALTQVNSFYSKGLEEVMKGGQPMPDLERLEKPLDLQSWMGKVKNAIVPTQNGYEIERSPSSIEQHFSNLWYSDPRAKKSLTEQYNGLPEDQKLVIANKAFTQNLDPVYVFGREFAVNSINGKTSKPLPKYITHPTPPKTTSGKPAKVPGSVKWIDQINAGDIASVEGDINLRLQSKGGYKGSAKVIDNGDSLTITIPVYLKGGGSPSQKITISKSDPNAGVKLTGVYNQIMGGTDVTYEAVKGKTLNTPKPTTPAPKPATKTATKTTTKPSTTKKFVGVPKNGF